MKTYRLKQAAEIVGVAPVTLKRWILSGQVPDVRRDRNGWRAFTSRDVARIAKFAQMGLVDEGPARARLNANRNRKLRVASLFSGIGGIDLGFVQAGYDLVFQCENNAFCTNILEKHWPDTPRWEDIRTLDPGDIPDADVWVGGFPCQDLSLARMGKRDGLRGSQSQLFHELARLAGEGRPRVLLLENVAGLLNSHRGRDLCIILGTLAELGYSVGWRTLNSKNFGVPQSRQRVYVVGCYQDRLGPAAILFEPERGEGHAAAGGQNGKKPASPFKKVLGEAGGKGPVIQSIAYCLYACSARHTGTDWSRNYVCYPSRGDVRRLVPSECEGVMAFPKDWTVPKNGRFRDDDIDSLRYYALGNAVTPPVSLWFAKKIAAYLRDTQAP